MFLPRLSYHLPATSTTLVSLASSMLVHSDTIMAPRESPWSTFLSSTNTQQQKQPQATRSTISWFDGGNDDFKVVDPLLDGTTCIIFLPSSWSMLIVD